MRCDEAEGRSTADFVRKSPFIAVTEGFHDCSFICTLLRHLKIDNCDVTYPKKERDGGNGKDRIQATLRGIASRIADLEGVLVIWDADEDHVKAFNDAKSAFVFDASPFTPPSAPFVIQPGRIKTAIYIIPGKDKNGSLEHLLFDAAADHRPDEAKCIHELCICSKLDQRALKENDRAKFKLATMIATCCDDPICSLGWIWNKKGNPIPIDSPRFLEISEFLRRFTSSEQPVLLK